MMVSASTKQSTRPELAATPALRAAAQVRPTQGTSRTPTSSANVATIAAVASSLPSSATMISKEVSGSQRSWRETPEARTTLATMASRTSPISASSLRAGITKERRVSLLSEGLRPSDSPTRALARRSAGLGRRSAPREGGCPVAWLAQARSTPATTRERPGSTGRSHRERMRRPAAVTSR